MLSRQELEDEAEQIVFSLFNNDTSSVFCADDGYYIWYCINYFDTELCEANRQTIIADRRLDLYNRIITTFVSGLDFSLNTKTLDKVYAEAFYELSGSVFEEALNR